MPSTIVAPEAPALLSKLTGKAFLFESKPCGRCGGSGHYSYCQRYGTTCFGCAGAGIALTKRGHATQAFYNGLLSKPAHMLQVGDTYREMGITKGGDTFNHWAKVTEVRQELSHGRSVINGVEQPQVMQVVVTATSRYGDGEHWMGIDTIVRVAASAETKQDAIRQALAFQATLTQAGTPRKR